LLGESGNVTDAYDYDAFGNLIIRSGTTDNAFTYRGEQMDRELGFENLRHRWMDPSTGRFVTRDTWLRSRARPTAHSYSYGANDPVTFTDPLGQDITAAAVVASAPNWSFSPPLYLVGNPLPTGLNPHVPTTDASGRTIDGAFHVESVVLDGFRELQTSTSRTVQRVYSDLRFAPKCIVVEVGDVPQGYRGVTYDSMFLNFHLPHFFECHIHPLYIDISPGVGKVEHGWILAHELSHAWDYFFDRVAWDADEDESCTHGQDITEDEERQNSHCRGDLLKADLQTGSADWTPRRGNEAP